MAYNMGRREYSEANHVMVNCFLWTSVV